MKKKTGMKYFGGLEFLAEKAAGDKALTMNETRQCISGTGKSA